MARRNRACPAGIAQHLIQRGNNRQPCFGATEDFAAYAHWLREASERFEVSVHAWVFMTNHVHLLATPERPDGISRMMQHLGRLYVRYFNHQYGRSGTLWEGRFKSCLVQDSEYLLHCYRYIELNPVRAGMVSDPADYRWSSYRVNALGVPSGLCTPHPEYLALGNDSDRLAAYRRLFRADLDEEPIADIRRATERGLALGDERFVREMEARTGTRLRVRRPGPRPRTAEDGGTHAETGDEFLL
ncbi:MAG: transposase [Halofilum sp. (in: g-proteobacteria)]|nr:transposase [Halofilum sp. (in: g-proteobacteria)]